MGQLFISHSSLNNDKAVLVRDWLVANGWDDIFLDLDPKKGLAPGEHWQDALKAAADRCQAVLVLISPEWQASRWCQAEFLLAKQLGKRLFPMIVGKVDFDSLPVELIANHQIVDLVDDPQGWERLKIGLRRGGLDPEAFPFPKDRRPYPGFEPLVEDDAAIFFGREAQIVRGLDRLRSMSEAGVERMLVILGASGAGKSSFLRAGLWPRLKRDDLNFLPLPVIRPERGVLTGKFGLLSVLEAALNDLRVSSHAAVRELPRSRGGIEDLLTTTPDGLHRLFDALRTASTPVLSAREPSAPPTIVVAIDQAEELFNEEGRAEANRFMDILAGTLAQDRRVIVILSIRSDAFPRLQEDPMLAGVGKQPFDLPPLPAGSLRLVIEGPARVANPPLEIDPQLVEALLEDASGQDTLPLLAFTLGRLFRDYGAEGQLTLEQYDRLGRIKGAVNAAVSEVFDEGARRGLLPRDKSALDALLRETFIPHLARVNQAGQFARRVASKAELPPRVHPLIDLFVDARLLLEDRRSMAEGDADVIEVAHEALLREWPALRGWLEADREFLLGKEKLAEDLAIWRGADADQKSDALLSGLNLGRARQWLSERGHDLTDAEREFIELSVAQRRGIVRRRRQLIAASIVVLFAVASVAVWQAIVASGERDIAQDRLNLARNSAETLVSSIVTDLGKVQGLQIGTVRRILNTAQLSFDKLSSSLQNDPAFQKSRASMMSAFGETYKKAGDLEDAMKSFDESLKIYRQLAEKDKASVDSQRGIADQIENMGLVLQQRDNLAGAMDKFKQAFAIREASAAAEPNNPISHSDLAWSHYNFGEILLKQDKRQEALENQLAARASMEHALSAKGDDNELRLKLSLIYISLGTVYQALHQNEERLKSNLAALEIRKQLVALDPDNAEWQRMLSWAYDWVGGSYADAENWDEALKNYQDSRDVRLKLVQVDPSNLRARYDLAWAYHHAADVLKAQGQLDQALENYGQALKIREELTAADKTNKRWRKDLALSYSVLAEGESQTNPDAAAKHYAAARSILEELTANDPSNVSWWEQLTLTCNGEALLAKSRGDLESALARYQQALDIRRRLLDRNPNEADRLAAVATSEFLVGDVLQRRNDFAAARDHYERSLDLRRAILEKSSDDANQRKELEKIDQALASLPASTQVPSPDAARAESTP